jgi:hypothetical protein
MAAGRRKRPPQILYLAKEMRLGSDRDADLKLHPFSFASPFLGTAVKQDNGPIVTIGRR